MNILIIEDDVIWQVKVQIMIEELGYTVSKCCSTSKQVEDYLATEQPDLIIADIVLKDELIFELRDIFIKQNIPCIFMTSALIERNYEQTKVFSKTRFLVKPFHAFSLRDAIDSLEIKALLKNAKNGIWVMGKLGQKILIKFNQILSLESEGNYTTIHTIDQKKYVVKKALVKIAPELSPKFLQIQRAAFVNADYISRVDFSQEELNLNGTIMKVGRKYHENIATYINKK
jgi:two-component system, LytTR family, response regulator LytT